MKKIISTLLLIAVLISSVLMAVGCNTDEVDSQTGLLYKKVKNDGNSYYIVYGYKEAKDGDGYKDLKKVDDEYVLDIEEFITDKELEGEDIIIGENAFKGNSRISGIILPSSVIEIRKGAFSSMSNLKSLTVPFIGKTANADSSIGGTGSSSVKSVDVERTMYYWFSTSEFDGGTVVNGKYNSTDSGTDYYLPCGLNEINIKAKEDYSVPAYACYGNGILEKVSFENVKEIGDFAFANCYKLSGNVDYGDQEAIKTVSSTAFENTKVNVKEKNN